MRRLTRKILFIASTAVLLLCFQNFSYQGHEHEFHEVPPELLDPNFSSKPQFAVPQSGHDLESVVADWSNQQKDILLEGRDQKFFDKVNDGIQKIFSSENEEPMAPAEPEVASTGAQRGPASVRFTSVNQVQYKMGTSSVATYTFDGRNADLKVSKDLGGSQLILRHQSEGGNTSVRFNLNF